MGLLEKCPHCKEENPMGVSHCDACGQSMIPAPDTSAEDEAERSYCSYSFRYVVFRFICGNLIAIVFSVVFYFYAKCEWFEPWTAVLKERVFWVAVLAIQAGMGLIGVFLMKPLLFALFALGHILVPDDSGY